MVGVVILESLKINAVDNRNYHASSMHSYFLQMTGNRAGN